MALTSYTVVTQDSPQAFKFVYISIFFFAIYLLWPVLFQVTTVERKLCGSGSTWRRLRLLSRPHGCSLFTYSLKNLLLSGSSEVSSTPPSATRVFLEELSSLEMMV